jgi:hypothetical protein
MLPHPAAGHLLASAGAAAIGTMAAGFTAIVLAVADPAPAPAAATDAGATQLYVLVGVILLFVGGLVKNAIDLRKGMIAATAGTDRERAATEAARAEKLQAQLDETNRRCTDEIKVLTRRHTDEITELTRRHTAEVAEWIKIDARHKGIVAENIARANEQARQIEDMNSAHRELIETNRDLTRRIAELGGRRMRGPPMSTPTRPALRCRKCGRVSPDVRRGPGTHQYLCPACWFRTPPRWDADDKARDPRAS